MRLEIAEHVSAGIREAQALAAAGDGAGAGAAYRALLADTGDVTAHAVAVLHMLAIVVDDPDEKLAVNEEALARADADPAFPPPLRATLLANLAYSHRQRGDLAAARARYLEAREAAAGLDDDEYGTSMRAGIADQLASLGD